MLKFNVREEDRKTNISGQKQLGPHNTVIHTTQPIFYIYNILVSDTQFDPSSTKLREVFI